MRKLMTPLLIAAALLVGLVVAGPAAAKDRNNDRIPDRWEKRHGLPLKVNQAKRDQDGDGLRNRAEFRAGLDPRDSDTDDDGVSDGSEGAGKIQSYDAETGELTINLFGGRAVTGLVNDRTKVICGCKGKRGGGDDAPEEADAPDDAPATDEGRRGKDRAGDRRRGPRGRRGALCGPEALVEGAIVHGASAYIGSDGLTFHVIRLVKPERDAEADADSDSEAGPSDE